MTTEEQDTSATQQIVLRFASWYHPAPRVVLLAGSRARGTFSQNSDYDLVLLYPELPQGAWREMTRFEDAYFEVFAHDVRTLAYFFWEIERPSAKPVLARMIHEGITVRGEGNIETEARDLARDFLASGPMPLEPANLAQRRYAITNLAEALSSAVTSDERLAIGSSLYLELAEFVLRANRLWVGSGKGLPPALGELRPDLQDNFTNAFERLYQTGEDTLVQSLITDILEPFGGRLRAGFRQEAPASWRSAKGDCR